MRLKQPSSGRASPGSSFRICRLAKSKYLSAVQNRQPNSTHLRVPGHCLEASHALKAAIACVELCRDIGNSAPLRLFAKREVMPGNLKGPDLENFVRDALTSYAHQTCTAKMGCDSMSVVDGTLKVYGVDNLRVADGSIMPRVTTGNTMAPCVIIGERAGEILKLEHKL